MTAVPCEIVAYPKDNLRAQTQICLDEGFLGFATIADADELPAVGVGLIDKDMSVRPNAATNRSYKGDFNTAVAAKMNISPEQRPWLFVVKKNKTVLERLLHWIRNRVANHVDPETGRKLVTITDLSTPVKMSWTSSATRISNTSPIRSTG